MSRRRPSFGSWSRSERDASACWPRRSRTCPDVQADELWTFIRCKQGTWERRKITDLDAGDAYCYIGIERHSKLVLAWHLGRRNSWDAHDFIEKLGRATAGEFQLSTDGFNGYPNVHVTRRAGQLDAAWAPAQVHPPL